MGINEVNKALKRLYGIDPGTGLQHYRLVRAGEQIEKRKGTYDLYYGQVYVRTESGILEVPKYNYLAPNKLVVEKLVYHDNKELVGPYSYEPLWSFDEGLPPNLDACNRVVQSFMNLKDETRRVDASPEAEKREFDKEVELFEEKIKEGQTEYGIRYGEGISLAGLDIPKRES